MIILDFDGVLINSVDEVIATAFFAITGWAHYSLDDLPPSYVAHFRANRFHVQPAGDLLPLGSWCLRQPPCTTPTILSAGEFKEILASAKESLAARREKFFGARTILVNRELASWLSLSPHYYPLWGALQLVSPEKIVILTNKNKKAVVDITQHWGLKLHPSRIYSSDGGISKSENMTRIMQSTPGTHIEFVDDSIGNLLDVRRDLDDKTVSYFLASWGYVGPEDKVLAKENHIQIVEQADVLARFALQIGP